MTRCHAVKAQQNAGPFVANLNAPPVAPLLDPNHNPSPSDIVGNGECVSACKKFAGLEGTSTSQWRAGEPVVIDGKINPNIKPGTAIATFDSNGRYPGQDDPHKNSGIFLGAGVMGGPGSARILDQWPAYASNPAHPPQPRDMRYYADPTHDVSNNSHAYYVIMLAR